ncbi:MAG: FtsH protease activity modulator HflK, partial [Lachnospiraceae bacterium]|nr:FtsH protease activity modulator HflK [Lachnospiraceae bacterium]
SQERVIVGSAQGARFIEMYAEYEKNPLLTKQRMFYETMEEVLPGVKLIIDDGSGTLNKTLYLDELQLEDITDSRFSQQADDAGTQEGH